MSERTDTDRLAERLLDEPGADPDDDLRMLSRQLLRRREVIDRLEKRLTEMLDPTADLINANRDTILRIHEEGLAKIDKIVRQYVTDQEANAIGALDARTIRKIIAAVNSFHPMHGENFSWPEGSS